MADMKGFYRHKKKSGISKPNSSKRTPKQKYSASCGAGTVQPPALIAHGSLDLQGLISSPIFICVMKICRCNELRNTDICGTSKKQNLVKIPETLISKKSTKILC